MIMALLVHASEMCFVPKITYNPNPNVSKLHSFQPLALGKAIGLRQLACKVKDGGVLDLDPNLRSYGQKAEEEEKHNYCVNMGYAIRTLREDFPSLFYRELCFDIFRDDIVFKDPLNTFIGIENYKSIFWALRFHGRILSLSLNIIFGIFLDI